MKPINLKIKGLNSFIDSQEINFEKLTDKGLFGIFGPTGSGKSTVLDGITLALYGEVARKSSNFMNTNCDSLNVSYEFQMSEKEIKRYRIDREFKRDNKNGGIKTKSVKVIDITNGNEEVLEEGVKAVNDKCEEIIGLKLEDFTRTVVLPQGKFSEFLKLEGKERRNMLERLFNLQRYGDGLSSKLSNKIKEQRQKSNLLEGELKGFENISKEILKEKRNALTETKEQYKNCQTQLENAEDQFNKGKELWDLQNEMKVQEIRKIKILEKEQEINENQRKLIFGESALKVKPYIENYESTLNKIELAKKQLNYLSEQAEIIKTEKEKIEISFESIKFKKEIEIPQLKVKEQKIIDAIEESIILKDFIKEKSILSEEIKKLEENFLVANSKIKNNDIYIKNISDEIKNREIISESLKVDEEYKKKLNDGLVVLSSYENLVLQKSNLTKEINKTTSYIEETLKNTEILSKELNEKHNAILGDEKALKKLIDECPGDQSALLNLQENLANVKDKWNKYNEYNTILNSSNKNVEILKNYLVVKDESKIVLENEIKELNDNIKKIETENIAHTLRNALQEGESCPVCGSKDHHKELIEIIDLSNLDELKKILKIKEEKLNKLTSEINKAQANTEIEIVNKEDKEKKLSELGEEFKNYSVEKLQNEFDKLKIDISNYNSEKNNLENKIKVLNEEKNNLNIKYNNQNTILIHNRELLKKFNDDFKTMHDEFEVTNNKLLELKKDLSIEDFKSTSEQIYKKEKERIKIENEIKILRENLTKAQDFKEKLNKAIGAISEDLSSKNTAVIEKNKNIKEKEESIKNKVGDKSNLETFKEQIIIAIKNIEKQYITAESNKKHIENQFNECNDKKISSQGNLISLNERILQDKNALQNVLDEQGFNDINDVKSKYITKSEIDKLKLQIEDYKSALTKITIMMDNLKNKINSRSLTEEKWLEIQNIKNEISEKLKQLTENNINLETEVKIVEERLINKNDLLKKKEELDYKLSTLSDLESLFKGKKFVEFVAANQLKYVSMEACKKLKEITNGNYGLEVDENGKFIIRDYKNGGAQRDASTLSGGETFVASLALALALSAQIQLKGTAPLELFFLDEGFGTLDDNLLEVVMDSLERIHNDKLSIGIISHVETIKNRVPVKLIVTAAEAGMGGSKVRIERN